MTYPVSPVAEDTAVTKEVLNTWFNRLSTMVVSASNQASDLKRLEEDFQIANHRLSELSDQNSKLKTEVAETWRLVSEMERERDEAKAQVEKVNQAAILDKEVHAGQVRDYEDRLSAAHDAMAGRDQRIAELEQANISLVNEKGNLATANSELERKLQGAESDSKYWHQRYTLVMEEKVKAQQSMADLALHNESLAAKLEQVQKTLGEAVALFAPPNFAKQPELPSDAGGYGFGDQDRYPPGRPSDDEIKF